MQDYDYSKIRKAGSRVRALMDPAKDTVASLAIIINVTPSHMSKLLDDKCEWSVEKAIIISNYFNVPFEYIYYGIDIYEKTEAESFISHYRGMLMHLSKLPVEEQKVYCKEMAEKLLEMIFNW